jgi:hypothetical protein
MFWLTQDPEKVRATAREIADLTAQSHYFGDNLLTWGRNLSLLDDQPFVQAWLEGMIPDAFGSGSPEGIAFLHINPNHAMAEIAALDRADAYRPQKVAEDAWFDARHYRVMPVPTVQRPGHQAMMSAGRRVRRGPGDLPDCLVSPAQ